jgi:hypothetical protein
MSDELQLIRLPSGRYTWNRSRLDAESVRAGKSWEHEADCYDDMIDSNVDHRSCTTRYYATPASIAEGGPNAPHVKPPVPGYPTGPRSWSPTDPEARS